MLAALAGFPCTSHCQVSKYATLAVAARVAVMPSLGLDVLQGLPVLSQATGALTLQG